jgi:NodT family efflux transporter outer membrane factor (OMF) lipoprotein
MVPTELFPSRWTSSDEGGTARRNPLPPLTGIISGCLWLALIGLPLVGSGCTSFEEFLENGFKVGPNYQRPPAPLAPEWIDARNPRVKSTPADYSAWWRVFGDPVLDDLVKTAYEQNVNLRVAGTRVLEARAQRAIAVGELFPQQQAASGGYSRTQQSLNVAISPPPRCFDTWGTGFGVSWEIDFWGKIRRTIESTDDLVESSIDDFDNVMVTLIGDVATAYVQYRIFEQQIAFTQENITYQKGTLRDAEVRAKALTNMKPVVQAKSLLAQNESVIPLLEIGLRQANNQLCLLLGIPPTELAARLGKAPIPGAPGEVIVGIPADLIRRRPDLRAAERQIAAQNAQIGVAEANFYPAFFINGNLGYAAKDLPQLFTSNSFNGQVGPAFQWNILNYGRILNNVRLQDFQTQELVAVYQQKVLAAAQEAENGIDTYLRSREQAERLAESVREAQDAVKLARADFLGGATDYTPVFVAQQFLTQQQNDFALAQGNISLGLISVYRALGGGWELRLAKQEGHGTPAEAFPASGPPGTKEVGAPTSMPFEGLPQSWWSLSGN